MIRQKTSTFYFQKSCQAVWEAVTSSEGSEGFSFAPMSDEEYATARQESLQNGKVLAHVTDLTPGKSCGYDLNAAKFDVHWSSVFEPVGDRECRMVMTETYRFHADAVGQYLLSLFFLRQGAQHKAFRAEIEKRLG